MKHFDPLLYFITDSTGLSDEEFLKTVEAGLKGGATLIQLREKDKTAREYLAIAKRVHTLCQRFGVPLIIDDRLDIALAAGAEGVHLGQSDLPVGEARKIAGDSLIIGATAKSVDKAIEAYEQGADYLGVGAIYPTTTHVNTKITSTETLDAICRAVPIPVNAIGGLTKDNIYVLSGINIKGICAVSAIMKASDPFLAAAELKAGAKSLIQS